MIESSRPSALRAAKNTCTFFLDGFYAYRFAGLPQEVIRDVYAFAAIVLAYLRANHPFGFRHGDNRYVFEVFTMRLLSAS
jgi:hypothetical protein